MEITAHMKSILATVLADGYCELSETDRDLYYAWELQSLELVGNLELFWIN